PCASIRLRKRVENRRAVTPKATPNPTRAAIQASLSRLNQAETTVIPTISSNKRLSHQVKKLCCSSKVLFIWFCIRFNFIDQIIQSVPNRRVTFTHLCSHFF